VIAILDCTKGPFEWVAAMSIPAFASAARFPFAANTVDNLVHALLPQSLSKCASSSMITTAPPSEYEDKSVGCMTSWGLLPNISDHDSIQCSDDNSTDDHSSDEGVSIWDSEDAACSFGSSGEGMGALALLGDSGDGMEAPSHSKPITMLPSRLRRRSSVIQMSRQELRQGAQHLDVSTTGSDSEASPDEDHLAYIRQLKPDDFAKFLRAHHVPVEDYGRDKARCLQDLWAEVVVRECSLERIPNPMGSSKCFLQRRVRTIIIEIKATIEGQEKFLLLNREVNDHGHVRDSLDARVTTKMFDDEDIPSAMHRCLLQNLGMECSAVEDGFAIELEEDAKAVRESTAYPGLRTIYTMHLVHLRVRDISHPMMAAIGLPLGSSFTAQMMVSALGVGKRLTWSWCMRGVMKAVQRAKQGRHTSLGRAARCKTLRWFDEPYFQGSAQV